MYGMEKALCNAALDAVISAYYAFMNSDVKEALRRILRYGKGDTLGLDAMPEITIIDKLEQFDPYAVIITEETGTAERKHFAHGRDPQRFRTVFISDPTDRSSQMKSFLGTFKDKSLTVQEIVHDPNAKNTWEKNYGSPAEITSCASAITCIRRGVPIFSISVNYLTEQLFVACSAGIFSVKLPSVLTHIDLDYVQKKGQPMFFRPIDPKEVADMKRFVTFLGKTGYYANLKDSNLMDEGEIKKNIHHKEPGGPMRILYLSTLQQENVPIGFILANGEKIGEWIHWLPYIRFARVKNDLNEPALGLFEVYQDRPWTKDGILMSTSPAYSIFREAHSDDDEEKMVIDVSRFPDFENPSKIRSTLIVAPRENYWATRVVNQYGYRPIRFDT